MIRISCTIFFLLASFFSAFSQHVNKLSATLNENTQEIKIQQEFLYVNQSPDTLSVLYFNDWANAYAHKDTPLAKRFADDFKKNLHLAAPEDRGATQLIGAVDQKYFSLPWWRTPSKDIIGISLNTPLAPGMAEKITFTYTVKLPPNKYTSYGYDTQGGYFLKDWYLSPAVYENGEWLLYANKDLQDLYTQQTHSIIKVNYPKSLFLNSNFTEELENVIGERRWATLSAKGKKNAAFYLNIKNNFVRYQLSNTLLVTDIRAEGMEPDIEKASVHKIFNFINSKIGPLSLDQLLVTQMNYDRNPLYGLNKLPNFINPYEPSFKFELSLLKTSLYAIFNESFYINPRKEQWVIDALVHFNMIKYVEEYHPEQKLLGKLSSYWGIKSLHLSELDFNDQYALLYNVTARRNLDQPLTTSNDSLIKFNQQIANKYKAGLGLAYLENYLGADALERCIRNFYQRQQGKPIDSKNFKQELEKYTDKNVDWFFDTYIGTKNKIDFKITKAKKQGDSIALEIKNKQATDVPISLFGLQKDSVVSQYWFTGIDSVQSFTISNKGEDRLVLNYDQKIPEFNQRDNWKSLNGWFSSNKKFKFQFFKDLEDPNYNQIFYVPIANYNLYDGLTPGLRLYNKTFLERPFNYDIAPTYGLKGKKFVGYGRLNYRKYHNEGKLYLTQYNFGASSYQYTENARYTTLTPSFSMGWRPEDLRSNKRSYLNLRYVQVHRDPNPNATAPVENQNPNYGVLNLRYGSNDNGILKYFSWNIDAQQAKEFTKMSFEMEYRRLFENNRQFNIRFFAGSFLSNKSQGDFFSFALDRPTDYLFDYGFLGRSEDMGLYAQQIIIAEGGFKSKLENPFANQWMVTTNASVNIYRWLEFYTDFGFMKNKGFKERLVYDSGLRLNLVTDYFELYFPLYSNNGWESGQENYAEKIRFVVTLSPKTLMGLFSRRWF
ncbi:MAG: Uncharacterised protein [SAR116 cluster bacterium]|nr:MAG: Uncharacterised protein [SAR116 cluster bacterium]